MRFFKCRGDLPNRKAVLVICILSGTLGKGEEHCIRKAVLPEDIRMVKVHHPVAAQAQVKPLHPTEDMRRLVCLHDPVLQRMHSRKVFDQIRDQKFLIVHHVEDLVFKLLFE